MWARLELVEFKIQFHLKRLKIMYEKKYAKYFETGLE